ncbi:hypothetical protein WMF45_38845 [Sorangium sp. So ce448]|uniref:hypothetical protein n=1 Tax=Sorangium sp. So ce448 TaxID=3133314 RepID=UPI003F6399A1
MSLANKRHLPKDSPFTESEFALILQAVATNFSLGWLEASSGAHPLQRLWRRLDHFATLELVSLGVALRRLSSHTRWLRQQVALIKGKDSNNSAGALFEILGLAHFDHGDNTVVPANQSQPGFDGLLRLRNGATITLSLKRYGPSDARREFFRQAEVIRHRLQSILPQIPLPGFRFNALAGAYPSAAHWKQLASYITATPEQLIATTQERCGDIWSVQTASLAAEVEHLSSVRQSLFVLLIAPQHPNDPSGFFSKIEDACRNLARHGPEETDRAVNAVYIHLAPNAPFSQCKQWATEWLQTHPNRPVSLVLLYQASIVRAGDKSFVLHCFDNAVGPQYLRWISSSGGALPHILIPIGRVGNAPATTIIHSANGAFVSADLLYVFQGGDIYQDAVNEGETQVGFVEDFRSGVHIHSVLEPLRDGRKIIASGHFSPEDELLIL